MATALQLIGLTAGLTVGLTVAFVFLRLGILLLTGEIVVERRPSPTETQPGPATDKGGE